MDEARGRRVQDNHLGRAAHQLLDPAFEIERQPLEGRGRRSRVKDRDVDVAPSARRSPRHAAEQVGGDDLAGLSREELPENPLDGADRHAGIIARVSELLLTRARRPTGTPRPMR